MAAVARDADVQEGLRRNNARFVASMNRILERYNHPFEDDLVVSLDTLTYDAPDGPKQWGQVSNKDIKNWKKQIFKHNRQSRTNTEISNERSSDVEDEYSTVYEDSSDDSAVDSSDIGEDSGDVVSVRRKFEDFHLQCPNADDGQILKKERVPVDLIVQDDERKIPKWIRNPNIDDGQILKKERVPVDLIVQDDERKIPKWITMTSRSSSKGHSLTLSMQEPFGNQAAVDRKKLELSNEYSSSKYLHLQHSGVPISSNQITSPRHRPCPERSRTFCDSIHGEYQSADEECSWSNTTLGDLYPSMVATFTRLMTKQSQKKVLKYVFRHLKSKNWHSRRPKFNVTVDNMRGLAPRKPKNVFHSMRSHRSKDKQNPSFGDESREFCYDDCLISNSSGLAPYAYTDTKENKMDYSDSSLEQLLASGKGQKVSKHTAFLDVTDRMGETFIVEDEVQTTASPKNSEYTESEKSAYKRFSEYDFRTSTASSDSRAFHFVKESNTQKTDTSCVGDSELCSFTCSSHGNSNDSIPIMNCSARSSNTVLIYPEKIIPERQTSFQHKVSFSPWFRKQSPSKMPNKYGDAFDELYYKARSEKYQKPLTVIRPLLNSQNFEEKGRLVRSHSSDFLRSTKQCDIECDRSYVQLYRESVPKFPGFQTASNFRKYEEIQMPAIVNALVNSPVRTYSAISRVKRAGNFQNYLPCSPLKRLKLTPENCFSLRQRQEISHRKKVNRQTAGMDVLSTYNCSNPSFFADRNYHCQDSGSHDSSDKTFDCIPDTSLQDFGTAGVHSGCPGAMENCCSPRNVRKRHSRVYRKLSYTDGKDQL